MSHNQLYRARARQDLGGSVFHSDWSMAALVCLTAGVILSGPSLWDLVDESNVSAALVIGLSVISLATIFLAGPIGVGQAGIFLKKARHGGPIVFGELFQGFRRFWYWEYFLLAFMRALFLTLWSLIPIVGLFIAIYKGYGYAMSDYVKAENPTLRWRECLDRSTKMMQGYRWALFKLQFSFIGWYILGALALGVGAFWVEAYRNAAEAHFYEAHKLWHS